MASLSVSGSNNAIGTGLEPSENWDDDFEFNPSSSPSPAPLYEQSNPHTYATPTTTRAFQQFPTSLPDGDLGSAGLTPGTRMSIASSEYTMEDWDAESQFAPSSPVGGAGTPTKQTSPSTDIQLVATPTKQHQRSLSASPPVHPQAFGVLTDSHAMNTLPVPISVALAAWSEDGPKTPVRSRVVPANDAGENWDDDFEDRTLSSPGRKAALVVRRVTAVEDDAEAHESWDEEFAAEEQLGLGPPPPPSRRTPVKRRKVSKPKHPISSSSSTEGSGSEGRAQRKRSGSGRAKLRYSLSEDGDFYDSDEGMGEFGFEGGEEEEDRTVTARSKKGFHHHHHHHKAKESPPPPVPRLPSMPFLASPLLPASVPTSGPSNSSPKPFPRSPTSSVFSVPATLTETRSYTSTTRLRPSESRGSGSSLSHLPPSPPIHKDRERRRLRKKSRPSGGTTYEMAVFSNGSKGKSRRNSEGDDRGGYLYSFSDGELEDIREKDRERDEEDGIGERILPRKGASSESPPALVPAPSASAVAETEGESVGPSVTASVPQTPRGPGALLSRIGSVTSKWGKGRRSRGASMTPSEVGKDDTQQHTPRPQSSMSSLHLHLSHSNSNSKLRKGDDGRLAPPTPSSRSSSHNPTGPSPAHGSSPQASSPSNNSSGWLFRNSSRQSDAAQSGTSPIATPNNPNAKSKSKYAPRSVGRGERVGAARGGEGAVTGDDADQDEGEEGVNAYENGGEWDKTPVATPAKLVKRRSMGFVALRRGLGVAGERVRQRDAAKAKAKEGDGESSAGGREGEGLRERKDGGVGVGRPVMGVRTSGGKVRGVSETHKKTRLGDEEADPFVVAAANTDTTGHINTVPIPSPNTKEKEKETTPSRDLGLRSILGNVRRLSIVGAAGRERARHKRTQSSVSVATGSPSAVAIAIAGASASSPTSGSGTLGRMSMSGTARPLTPSTSVPQLGAAYASSSKVDVDTNATMKTPSKSSLRRSGSMRDRGGSSLLPPIELQPPSPSPPSRDTKEGGSEAVKEVNSDLQAGGKARSPLRAPHSPGQSASLGRASPFVVANGVTATTANASMSQLHESSTSSSNAVSNTSTVKDMAVLRRNSLGDLKIPARISQAQVSLRRDLGMVREFASHVESLKVLQNTYNELSVEIHALLDKHAAAHARAQVQQTLMAPPPPPASRPESRSQNHSQNQNQASQGSTRANSPLGFFNLGNLSRTNLGLHLKGRRKRSSTNPEGFAASTSVLSLAGSGHGQLDESDVVPRVAASTPYQASYKELATALYTINSKYRISWECAELLIELGGGAASGGAETGTNPGVIAPVAQRSSSRTSARERAVTLAGDSRPGTPVQGSLSGPGSRVGSYSSTSSHQPHPLNVNVNAHYGHSPSPHTHAPPMSSPLHGISPSHSTPAVPTSSSVTSPPLASPASWRASTGRHDLSQRQLSLLKEMLNHPEGSGAASAKARGLVHQTGSRLSIAEEPAIAVNREWKWGADAMGSTITLPVSSDQDGEESGSMATDRKGVEKEQKKRKKINLSGFRDMLRALRRGAQSQAAPAPAAVGGDVRGAPVQGQGQQVLLARTRVVAAASTTSLSAGSSYDGHSMQSPRPRSQQQTQRRVIQKRRPMSSQGTEDTAGHLQQTRPSSTTPYASPPLSTLPPPSSFAMPMPPKSPRRPSLASIFRIGTSSSKASVNAKGAAGPAGPPDSATDSNKSRSASDANGSSSSCYPDDEDDDGDPEGDDGDQDWDQIDSASDLDGAFGIAGADAGATIRGASTGKGKKKLVMVGKGGPSVGGNGKRSPYLQQDPYAYRSTSGLGRRIVSAGAPPPSASTSSVNASQTSLTGSIKNSSGNPASTSASPGVTSATGSVRQLKLSDVQENAGETEWRASLSKQTGAAAQKGTASPHSTVGNRSVSGGAKMTGNSKTGSVRSMPPQPFSPASASSVYSQVGGSGGGVSSSYPDIKLTFTPENIRPLLENAREVQMRLKECVEEMRALVKRDAVLLDAGEAPPP